MRRGNRLKNNNRGLEIRNTILIFWMVYVSMDTLLFGTNRSLHAHTALVCLNVLLAVVLLYMIFKKQHNNLRINKNCFFVFFALIGLIFITQGSVAIQRGADISVQYYYHGLILIIAMLIVELMDSEEFVSAYVNTMLLFAFFSVLLYVINVLGLNKVIPSIEVVNTSGFRYSHYLLAAIHKGSIGSFTARAYGVFREPGAFSVHLCIAIAFELFIKKKFSFFAVSLLSIAVFITYSTAGYIVLSLYVLLYIFGKKAKDRRERAAKIFITIACMAVLAIGVSDRVYQLVFGKLLVDNISANSRWISLWGGLRLSLQRPLLGWGWGYITNNFVSLMREYSGVAGLSFTNTYTRMACTYGWVFTLGVVGLSFRFFKKTVNRNRATVVLLYIGWLMALSNEAFVLNALVYYPVFAGAKKMKIKGFSK